MEVFGHALSGLCLGQALAPREGGRSWAVLAAISAIFPDIDAVSALWGYEAYREHHQIYTHNAFAFAVAPALAAAAGWRATGRRYPFARVWALFQLGMGLHLLGDVIAHWPLRFLYPLDHPGFAFGLIQSEFSFGVPLILLVGTLVGWLDGLAPWRRWTALATLAAATLYVLLGPGW